ncbi:hypothetical protein FH972_021622 [Carpinus fangiana]|uniref:STAS domain-containing protein n=1 Tax=Carpinus fangiana TaxID=176857 RepID=A0A5N6KPT8_9ROSI|nr:hypothetical protein FH972_021622 [Carpinus fangiana]
MAQPTNASDVDHTAASDRPASHSRTASNGHNHSRNRDYAPLNPSHLRNSQRPPPTPAADMSQAGDGTSMSRFSDYFDSKASSSRSTDENRPLLERADEGDKAGGADDDYKTTKSNIHNAPGNYGSFSEPHSPTVESPGESPLAMGGIYPGDVDHAPDDDDNAHSFLGDTVADGLMGGKTRMSTTKWLAKRHGVKSTKWMFVDYYVPMFKWIPQYSWRFLWGDLVAALTMASFYIPMSLSYASNLGHIPPINGLYSFVFNPLIYAFLGTCPQMVVGPEAAGSLLTGNVVVDSITKGFAKEKESFYHAQIAGVVTGVAGAILLLAGFARLGFLDNVLSRPFLRGFISAIGFVILVDQLIPEMGLSSVVRGNSNVQHGSSIQKAVFIFTHLSQAHKLTCIVSFSSFAIILITRTLKKKLQPRFPKVAYLPDRFAVVTIYTLLSWKLDWESQGVSILGDVKSDDGRIFQAHFPFDFSHMKHLESALSTSFLISLLGFFESSVAAKSLGVGPADGIQNIPLSANRELVALGTANILGGVFMSLPAFGGYGRSKVNASTGGKTPMSSVFLSLITVLCILFLLPAFEYIPKGVLSAMISIVAWSLIEEAPEDLLFFYRIRGWTELFLASLVFLATVLYSLPLGITCGIGFSLLRVIKHATRPRIQILGRVPGTEQFESAEADPERLEMIEGCLIVKIPEPLTFANTGDLRSRLRRLEDYGTTAAHPALPRVRKEDHNKNIIFDVHGVTALDGAGAQVFMEICQSYRDKGVRVFFCRVPKRTSQVWRLFESSGMVEICGGERHFVGSVVEALRLAETEDVQDFFERHPLGQGTYSSSSAA